MSTYTTNYYTCINQTGKEFNPVRYNYQNIKELATGLGPRELEGISAGDRTPPPRRPRVSPHEIDICQNTTSSVYKS